MPVAGVVSEINIYPVKSLGGIKLDKAIITKRGIAHPDNTSVADRYMYYNLKSFTYCFF
jgi:uncharacterized protein YcbX